MVHNQEVDRIIKRMYEVTRLLSDEISEEAKCESDFRMAIFSEMEEFNYQSIQQLELYVGQAHSDLIAKSIMLRASIRKCNLLLEMLRTELDAKLRLLGTANGD